MVLDVAPLSVGGVTSNSNPGTEIVPVHFSEPTPSLTAGWTLPLPVAPW